MMRQIMRMDSQIARSFQESGIDKESKVGVPCLEFAYRDQWSLSAYNNAVDMKDI